jgi:hypothetical protein
MLVLSRAVTAGGRFAARPPSTVMPELQPRSGQPGAEQQGQDGQHGLDAPAGTIHGTHSIRLSPPAPVAGSLGTRTNARVALNQILDRPIDGARLPGHDESSGP